MQAWRKPDLMMTVEWGAASLQVTIGPYCVLHLRCLANSCIIPVLGVLGVGLHWQQETGCSLTPSCTNWHFGRGSIQDNRGLRENKSAYFAEKNVCVSVCVCVRVCMEVLSGNCNFCLKGVCVCVCMLEYSLRHSGHEQHNAPLSTVMCVCVTGVCMKRVGECSF